MAQTNVIPKLPTSPRPPEIPPGGLVYMPEDSSRVHVPPRVGSIHVFEYAVEKLVRALEKVDARNKTEDAKPEATKHVEAEKSKVRASKLEYKLVDEVRDDDTSKYKIVDFTALLEEVTDLDEYRNLKDLLVR